MGLRARGSTPALAGVLRYCGDSALELMRFRTGSLMHRHRNPEPSQPMPHLPNPNPFRTGSGPEQRMRNLQRRFRAVSARRDRTTKLRWAMTALIAVVAILAAYPAIWLLVSSSWPITTTLRHLASAPNCDFARLVGLAPARRGEPGYWKHLDRDGDGVACDRGRAAHEDPGSQVDYGDCALIYRLQPQPDPREAI